MFAPDVEARFKRIEDELTVAAELLDRFEKKTDERLGHVEAVQNAMARWMEDLNVKMGAIADAHIRLEAALERYLRSRTNGGTN